MIVTVTRTGETDRLAAKQRPAQPIVALTGDPETCQRLALVRGVLPLLLPSSSQGLEEMIEVARRAARERGWPDMRAVFVSHERVDGTALMVSPSAGVAPRLLAPAPCADVSLDRLPARLLKLAPGRLLHRGLPNRLPLRASSGDAGRRRRLPRRRGDA